MDTFADDSSGPIPGAEDADPGAGLGADLGAGDPSVEPEQTTLQRLWRNEKYAPELLPFNERVVENMSEVVEFITSDLDEERAEAHDGVEDMNDPSRVLRTAELERIKYVLRDYLRIRLWKLTQWPQHYLESNNIGLLSVAERTFLREYWGNKKKFFESRLLSALPPAKQGLDDKIDLLDMIRRPNLEKFVYARLNVDLEVDLPQTGSVPASARSQGTSAGASQGSDKRAFVQGKTVLIRYDAIRQYLVDASHADGQGNYLKVGLV